VSEAADPEGADPDGVEGEGTDAAPTAPEVIHGAPVSWSRGQQVLHPARPAYRDVVSHLRADGFETCSDLTAADYLTHPGRLLPEGVVPERFEVVVSLLSLHERRRLRVRVQVPEGDTRIDSLFALFPGTEALEREAYDMFGIVFEGHPDLSRILMPDDWEGHPLRKDYGVGRIPVQFKGAPGPR